MNNGIQPTVELATNNGAYPAFYPMMMGGNGGFGNGYGSDWLWVIVLLALFGGWGNNNNGGFFGGNNFDDGYAWLSNGQKEIMQNTNNGFDTLHLSNQLEGTRTSIDGLSKQVCDGFYGVEISANNRQMADMQQNYQNTITNLQSFNSIQKSLDNCCCENRLATQDLKATVISENCADREVLREIGQNILVNQTANTQKIIDEIYRDRLDEKQDKIEELNRQLLMKDLAASQIAQTQAITSGIYNELKNCPIDTIPIYGNQRIFTCNNGCGCGNNGFYGNGTSF